MQTIYFMRHASPFSSTDWKGEDIDRPLSLEGEKEVSCIKMPQVAKIFVSPAKRAQDTAKLGQVKEYETCDALFWKMDDWLLSIMKELAESVEGDVPFIGHQGSFGQVLYAKPCELIVVKF